MFIADVHLSKSAPQITALFTKFITTTAVVSEQIYILGDLFDYWLGDDDHTAFNLSIIAQLHSLKKYGIKVYFMHGNRDFLINTKFAAASNCILIPDQLVIEVADKRILLMHGDTLCGTDTVYLKFRELTRQTYIQKLFLLLPIASRRAIARFLRRKSAQHTKGSDQVILDVTEAAVIAVLQQHQVWHLIHGHTHKPAQHELLLDGKIATRTVLAPWHEYGSVLVYHANGTHETIVIR